MVVPKVDIFDLNSGGKRDGLVLNLKGAGVDRGAVFDVLPRLETLIVAVEGVTKRLLFWLDCPLVSTL
jgi:hypothetical protein